MVNKFLNQGSALLLRRQTTILSAAVVMMILALGSKVLGVWRLWFLARYFGASGNLDAYSVAFVIPDILANVLIAGALSVAFIPIFTTYLAKKQFKEADILASTILNLALLVYAILGLLVLLFPYQLNNLVAPGLNPLYREEAANLTRLIVFGELFLVVGSFFTSVLQSYQRFIITMIAPVVYNLGIIFGIVVFSRFFGITGVGIGVLVGAFLHFLVQLLTLKKLKFQYFTILKYKDPAVRRVLKLSLPRAVAVGVGYLEWLVNIILASTLATGSIAILKLASDLQSLPISLFGVTMATAALPILATEWAKNKSEEFKRTFLDSLFQLLFLVVPVSVVLIVLRIPIARLAVGSGLFDWNATVATANTMSLFALGAFAQSGFLLVTRAFYAMHDTATPLKVALLSLVFHVVIAAYFITNLGQNVQVPVALLGLATSLSASLNFLILLFLLHKKVGGFSVNEFVYPGAKILVAALLMAVLLYVPLHLKVNGEYVIDYIIDTTRVLNLLFLTGAISLGGFVSYILVSWWFKSKELFHYLNLLPSIRSFYRILKLQEPIETTRSAGNP